MSDLFYFFKGVIRLTIFIIHKIGKLIFFLIFPLVPFLNLYSHYREDDIDDAIKKFDTLDLLIYIIGFIFLMFYLLYFIQLNIDYIRYLQSHPTLFSLWGFWIEPSVTDGRLEVAISLISMHLQAFIILFLFGKEVFKRTVFAFFVKLGRS